MDRTRYNRHSNPRLRGSDLEHLQCRRVNIRASALSKGYFGTSDVVSLVVREVDMMKYFAIGGPCVLSAFT